MPFFGNQVHTSGSPAWLTTTDMYGHFDPLSMGIWGMPIPACIVTKIWVYGDGPAGVEPDALGQFGIYDASSGTPPVYTIVATSPTWVWTALAPSQWWSVVCSIPLPAGTYSLAILANSAGTVTGGVHYSVKALGASTKTFIVPGVFPSPLGIVQSTTQNWTMYADYVLADGVVYTPTAACHSQPKCGEG